MSIDGTWQRRSHTSKFGVVFVISIVTGEVLDYELKSLHCHECASHSNDDINSEQYIKWSNDPKKNCLVNHVGTSDRMETARVLDIFLKSIKKHNLKYTTFVGDGDSGCFAHVKEKLLEVFGKRYIIKKEQCQGYIYKRIGTALREYKRKKKGYETK